MKLIQFQLTTNNISNLMTSKNTRVSVKDKKSEITFVLHSPLEFDNDNLSSQVVQERFRVNWYCLQYRTNHTNFIKM